MGKKSPRILLINFHSSLNAGDLALLECAIRILRGAFDNPEIVVAANWPDEPALKTLMVEIIPSPWHAAGVGSGTRPRWQVLAFLQGIFWAFWLRLFSEDGWTARLLPARWKAALLIYRHADLVVAVPGNQFFSSGRFGWPLPTIAFSAWLAHLFKKPLYILPQSIGPFVRRRDRWLLSLSYGRARRIYLRDQVSMRLAHEIGLPAAKVQYIPDPAFDYPPAGSSQAREVLRRYAYQEGQPALGLTILAQMPGYLNRASMDRYYQALATVLLRMAVEYQVQVFIFKQVTGPVPQEDDGMGTREVLRRMGNLPPAIHFVDETLPPQILKACYGEMDAFIASRLHSGIFSMAMAVPTLWIGYLTKTRGVLEAAGLDEYLIELSQMDENLLWEKLQVLWDHRQACSEQLKATLPRLILALQKIEEEIAEDYAQCG
jgi:colanic acid/amylovoran biosynthesis protein